MKILSTMLCAMVGSCGGGGGGGGDVLVAAEAAPGVDATAPVASPTATPASANAAPSARFAHGAESLDVTVDAIESTDTDGRIATYTWDFGDGTQATGLNASHRYAATGHYAVRLTVTDDQGASSTSTKTLSVPSYRSGLEDGAMKQGCTTREPNHDQPVFMPGTPLNTPAANGQMALKVHWQQAAYDGTRLKRGAEICPSIPVFKEAWIGFSFYLPSSGYPMDKSAGMFQIFQGDAVCNSWTGHMVIVNNSLTFERRAACVAPTVNTLLPNIPRDTWIPVIVHMVASHLNAGQVRIWVNGAPKNAPTYSATGINFGWRSWNADDTLTAANPIGIKFGQYNFDDGNYTPGETRTSYYDDIHVIPTARVDGWEAVNPVGASFASSRALVASSSQPMGTRRAAELFDDDPLTRWQSYGNTAWLLLRLPDGRRAAASGYSLTSSQLHPERDPRDWRLQGSNDGTTWITLDSRTGETFAGRMTKKSYSIGNATAYAYYRLDVSANQGGADVQLADWNVTLAP